MRVILEIIVEKRDSEDIPRRKRNKNKDNL